MKEGRALATVRPCHHHRHDAPAPCATRTSRRPSSARRRHRIGATAEGGRRRTAAALAGTASPPSPQRARAPGTLSLAAAAAAAGGLVWWSRSVQPRECGSEPLWATGNLRPLRTDSCSSLRWPTVPGASESHSGVPDSLAAMLSLVRVREAAAGKGAATGDAATNKRRIDGARCSAQWDEWLQRQRPGSQTWDLAARIGVAPAECARWTPVTKWAPAAHLFAAKRRTPLRTPQQLHHGGGADEGQAPDAADAGHRRHHQRVRSRLECLRAASHFHAAPLDAAPLPPRRTRAARMRGPSRASTRPRRASSSSR